MLSFLGISILRVGALVIRNAVICQYHASKTDVKPDRQDETNVIDSGISM